MAPPETKSSAGKHITHVSIKTWAFLSYPDKETFLLSHAEV
jgi:hypothetical protein